MTNISEEQFDELITAITRISFGNMVHGATGLEALSMSIGGTGDPGTNSVVSGLDAIANSLESVANGLQIVANAIESTIP